MAQEHVSRQGCLIGSLIMFTGSIVHPLLTLIITMEISIFSFLFVIYTFAINRYLPFVLWPIAVSEGRWGAPEVGVHSHVCLDTLKVTVLSPPICVPRAWAEHLWGWGRATEVR